MTTKKQATPFEIGPSICLEYIRIIGNRGEVDAILRPMNPILMVRDHENPMLVAPAELTVPLHDRIAPIFLVRPQNGFGDSHAVVRWRTESPPALVIHVPSAIKKYVSRVVNVHTVPAAAGVHFRPN